MAKKLTMMLAAAVAVAIGARAEEETVGGYSWTYQIYGDMAEICNPSWVAAISPKPTGAVTIPSTLGGKTVTSIGEGAFYYCSDLTSVTIPDSVTNIGWCAFMDCRGLTSVTIPDSVTSIGAGAFSDCYGLTNISVGAGNANYKSVDGLLLSKDGMTLIWCVNVTSMTIPDSVTSIGAFAFCGCSELTSLTIGNGVTSIGYKAFDGCSGLTNISVVAVNANYKSVNGLLLSKDGKTLVQGVNNSNVTIPDSVTSIGDYAFYGCSGLTSVTIPDSVTSIGDHAFYGCWRLTNVTIPDSVTGIGSRAFEDCSGLTSVTIPDSVTSIGSDAFRGCRGLTSVAIPDSVTSIWERAFYGCSGLTSVTIPDFVTSIGSSAFENCNGLTSVTIPDSVTNIGWCAFMDCSGLTSVTIPDSVTSIGERAFSGCSGLADVGGFVIVRSVVYDYYGSGGTVTIPDSVTGIGTFAFDDCSALTSVTIPDSVTSIGSCAFENCSGLTNIVFEGNAPSVGYYAFDSVNSGCIVYVPRGSTGWEVSIPGMWNGMTIRYRTDSIVTFYVGAQGVRIGGGALKQTVDYQSAAVTPEVAANSGWEFLGWDADFSCVVSNMTVNALWRRVYATGEAVGADAASASLPWTVGTNGVAAAKGYDDTTAAGSQSLKFVAADEASAWVETVVTNTCRVSFDWKSSCEPLVKGRPYDYLSFAVDGEQQAFICGETDWTSVTNYVTGAGEHVLRWTFLRDEDGSAGEDCAWLANVAVTPSVTVSFASGGATAGTVPEPITAYADERVTLPGQGSLAWPKHRFLGWSDGTTSYAAGAAYPCGGALLLTAQWAANVLSAPVITAPATYEGDSATVTITAEDGASIYYTLDGSEPDPARSESAPYQGSFTVTGSATIKAIAVKDDYFDSEVASATVTRLPWTFGEYLNWPEQTFMTGGDAAWTRVKGVSADGYALRSGVITHSQTSRLETVVSGPGTVTFSCKVAGEIVKRIVFDGLAFCVDGVQQGDLMGNADWVEQVFEVSGEGSHTLSWLYVKDEDGSAGEDCAWLDAVTWTPSVEGGLAAWLAERNLAAETKAANGRTAAECYALGLDPTLATNDFRIVSIEVTDDGTKVEWEPKTNRWTGAEIRAVLKGAASLEGPWEDVPAGGGSPGTARPTMRFFKVVVEGQ